MCFTRSAAAAPKSSPFLSTEGQIGGEEEEDPYFLCAASSHECSTNGDNTGLQDAHRAITHRKVTERL